MKIVFLVIACFVGLLLIASCDNSPVTSSNFNALVTYHNTSGKTDSVLVNGVVYRAGAEINKREDKHVSSSSVMYVFRGDANMDMTVDIEDISEIIAYLNLQRPYWIYSNGSHSCYYKCADCDGDYWHVDIADLTLLIDYLYISGDYSVINKCWADPYYYPVGACCQI